MRICVDLTSLADNFSGIERFALSITKELLRGEKHHWILLFKNSIHKEFEKVQAEKIVLKGNNKLVFNQIILPLNLLKIKADRYFFPAFPAPFFFFNKDAFNTIHDLSCWDCPGSNKRYMIWYFKLMYWKASLFNKKIVTVSEFSKNRICSILHVKPQNIVVVYNGVSKQFNSEKIDDSRKKQVVDKYSLPSSYILSLSTLEPRKNLRLLLDACAELYEEGVVDDIVLAGRKGWKMNDFLSGYQEEFLSHVYFTGFVDDEDLPAIYKMAKLFVFPSQYEGFGIPPLEAMACGTRVVSSDAASMPEVLGNAAVYFKSKNLPALKIVLKNELNLVEGNSTFAESGIQQAKKFNWNNEAVKLICFFCECQ